MNEMKIVLIFGLLLLVLYVVIVLAVRYWIDCHSYNVQDLIAHRNDPDYFKKRKSWRKKKWN